MWNNTDFFIEYLFSYMLPRIDARSLWDQSIFRRFLDKDRRCVFKYLLYMFTGWPPWRRSWNPKWWWVITSLSPPGAHLGILQLQTHRWTDPRHSGIWRRFSALRRILYDAVIRAYGQASPIFSFPVRLRRSDRSEGYLRFAGTYAMQQGFSHDVSAALIFRWWWILFFIVFYSSILPIIPLTSLFRSFPYLRDCIAPQPYAPECADIRPGRIYFPMSSRWSFMLWDKAVWWAVSGRSRISR